MWLPWCAVDPGAQATELHGSTGDFAFVLKDFPRTGLDPFRSGHPLTHYMKYNKFNVYLILREKKRLAEAGALPAQHSRRRTAA